MYVIDHEGSMREFIFYYIPKIWVVNIGNVATVPYWNRDEYENMKIGKWSSDTDHGYFREAFEAWMQKMKEAEEKGLLK